MKAAEIIAYRLGVVASAALVAVVVMLSLTVVHDEFSAVPEPSFITTWLALVGLEMAYSFITNTRAEDD